MAESDFLDRIIDEQNKQSETGKETSQPSETEPEAKGEVAPTEEGAEQEEVPKFYTPEEVEELLKTDGQVDFRKLSPEGQAIWKSVDRGLKPKLEEAARLREEFSQIQAQQAQPVQQAQPAPTNIYEMFVRDPDGVMRQVRNALYQTKLKDPFSEEVTKLEMLRDDLMEKRSELDRYQYTSQKLVDDAYALTKSNIPDYETKREKLTEFAGQLGFNRQELGYLTNPMVFGPLAAKLTLAINKVYDQMTAGDLKKKEVKKGLSVEKAGAGFETKQEEVWGDNSYLEMRKKSLL